MKQAGRSAGNTSSALPNLNGDHEDSDHPVKPILLPLDGDKLYEICTDSILEAYTDSKRRIREIRAPLSEEGDRPCRVFDLVRGKTFKSTLAKLDANLGPCGYGGRMLLARSGAVGAYDYLTRVIAALGCPPSLAEVRELAEHDERRLIAHHAALCKALTAFAEACEPSCWTAYFCNRQMARAHFLHGGGLRLKELCYGFIWLCDLPTQMLLYDGLEKIARKPRLKDDDFETRELVSAENVLILRFDWRTSRIVLILNWRAEDAGRMSDLLAETESTPTKDCSLTLARRYFQGWLDSSEIDISHTYEPTPIKPVDLVAQVVKASLCEKMCDQARDLLELALTNALQLRRRSAGDTFTTVHYTNQCPHTIGDTTYAPRKALLFKAGDYLGYEDSPEIPLRLNDNGLVNASVSALAACHNKSVLIENVDTTTLDGRSWRQISIGRKDFRATSELAVPFSDDTGLLGVVNVEAKIKLQDYHLRRTEIIVLLYSKLVQLYEDQQIDKEVKDNTVKLLSKSVDACALAERYCRELRNRWSADAVQLLAYDGFGRRFVTMGLSLSQQLAESFIADEYRALELDEFESTKLLESYNNDKAGMHRLLEHLIAPRLVPRERERTWRIFSERVSILNPDVANDSSEPQWLQRYFQILLGVPLQVDSNATADGVVWLGWREKRPEGWPGDTSSKGAQDAFKRHFESREGIRREIVASGFLTHRYFDPKGAVTRMPYAPPSEGNRRRRRGGSSRSRSRQ